MKCKDGLSRTSGCLRLRTGHGLDQNWNCARSWTGRGHGQVAATVSLRTGHGHGLIEVGYIAWTARGLKHDCCADIPGQCTDGALTLGGYCPEVARESRRHCREITPDISPGAVSPVRGHRVGVRRIFSGNCADIARLAALFLIRGWCLTKMNGFQFQKAARNHVRLNVSKLSHWCANDEALNERSETGSETEQVGSGINGRR